MISEIEFDNLQEEIEFYNKFYRSPQWHRHENFNVVKLILVVVRSIWASVDAPEGEQNCCELSEKFSVNIQWPN